MNDNVVLTSGRDVDSNRLPQGKRRRMTRIIAASAVALVAGAGILAGALALFGGKAGATGPTVCTWTAAAAASGGNAYWSTAGNWDCGNGTGNGPPAGGDAVVFPATVPSGSGASTPNLDVSGGSSASPLASITFDNSYTLNITSSATTLYLSPPSSGASIEVNGASGTTVAIGNSSTLNGSVAVGATFSSIQVAAGNTLSAYAPIDGLSGTAVEIAPTSGNSGGTIDLYQPFNNFGTTLINGVTVSSHIVNAFPVNTALETGSGATYNLNGNSQEVSALDSTGTSGATGTITSSTGTPTLEVSGANSSYAGVLGGSLSLLDYGPPLTLSGVNTYTGATTVEHTGTLTLGSSGALGGTSGVTVKGASTLQIGFNFSVPLVLGAGGGQVDTLDAVNSGDTWSGPITLTGGSVPMIEETASSAGTFAITGPVTGSASNLFVDAGSGTLTLSGSNDYTGTTTVGSGTLVAGSASALGATTSTPGSGGLVTVSGGATLQVGSMTSTSLSLPNDLVLSGGATLASSARPPSSNTDFYVEGSVTLDGQADVYAGFSSNLYLDGQVTGSGGITSTGQYTTWVTGLSNDYSGGTTVGNSGTLVVEASGGLGTGLVTDEGNAPIIMSGSISLPNDMALAGSNYCGGIVCDGSSAFTPSIPAGNDSLSGNITLYGDTTVAGGHSSVLQLSGDVSGGYGLTTIGNVAFSGTNSYTGATTVEQTGAGQPGVLTLESQYALGSPSGSTSGVTVKGGSILQIFNNGTGFKFSAPLVLGAGGGHMDTLMDTTGEDIWSGPITLTAGSDAQITEASPGGTFIVSGSVSGTATASTLFVDSETGGGHVLFSGTNDYSESTIVYSGTTLTVTNVSALGATTSTPGSGGLVTVSAGATLQLASGSPASGSPACLPSGLSPANFTLPNDVVLYADGASGSEGLDACSGSNAISGGVSLSPASGHTTVAMDMNTRATLTLLGKVSSSGSGALQLGNGAGGVDGTLVLSGTNSYTGATTVADGTLEVTGSIASSSGVTVEGGATLDGTGTVPAVTTSGCASTSPCTVYPGDAPGTLTSTGYANLSATGSTLQVALAGTSPGYYSELVADGANVTGTILDVTSVTPAPYGTVFDILRDTSSSPITGRLYYGGSAVTQGEVLSIDGRKYQASYTGGTGNDFTLTDLTNPPPPAPAPVITSISPTSGPVAGGTTVTIDGSNLFGAAYVFFGNTQAVSFSIVSSTEIQATSPAESAGTVNVTVTTPGGTSATSSADQFTYQASTPPKPTVTSITPTSGSTAGGTSVTITGTNFTSGATVMFGTVAATAVTYNSPTYITAISPAESAGTVNVTVTTTGGTSSTSSTDQFTYLTPISGDAYIPINPQRLADTRCSTTLQPSYCSSENLPNTNASLTSLAGNTGENVTVTGIDGIPSNATAVVINVTVLNMTSGGYLSIYPEGTTPFVVSSLNWTKNSGVVTNLVTVPVNTSNGEITFRNGGTSSGVNFVVDIEGYYAPPGSTPVGLYNPVTPSRIVDTRCSETSLPVYITNSYCASLPSANSKLTTLGTGQIENVTVTGVGGIPSSGVSAVVLNLTAIGPTSSGYLSAFPTGATKAEVSTVNFNNQGEIVSNSAIVKVGSNGQISIYNFLGNTNFTIDVSGYYTDGSSSTQSGSLFNPVTPARILDTRCSTTPQPSYCPSENLPSVNATLTAIPGGSSITVQVAGEANIPTDATAVVGNLSATDGTGSGYLTVYAGSTVPTTSDVNFSAGSTNANMVISGLSSSGSLNIANGGGHRVDVLFDVSGWFTAKTS